MAYYQWLTEDQIEEAVHKFGPSVGATKMMDWEMKHAEEAIKTGIYITFYNDSKKSECSRLGTQSLCFCGHIYQDHIASKKLADPKCSLCKCPRFANIPQRPEEVGQWWLVRRKDFDVNKWKAKCKCQHPHTEHIPTPPYSCKSCKCFGFHSDFACISCDSLWEDHVVLYETEQERKMIQKSVGDKYKPLSMNSGLQNVVFDPEVRKKNALQTKQRGKLNSNQPPGFEGHMMLEKFKKQNLDKLDSFGVYKPEFDQPYQKSGLKSITQENKFEESKIPAKSYENNEMKIKNTTYKNSSNKAELNSKNNANLKKREQSKKQSLRSHRS